MTGRTIFSLGNTLSLSILLFIFSVTIQSAELEATKPLEIVSLQLKWIHQFQFAGYYAAKQQGYYADEGLDVQFFEFNPEKPIVQQVVSGVADYAIGDVGILLDYANGEPIKALAAIFQHNPLVFITKQSSGIISPYEMSGKRIMQQDTASNDASLRAMLADADITREKYTLVKHRFTIDDFILNKIDVMPVYISNEPFAIRKRGVKINIIKPQNYGTDFYGDILFTSDEELKQHPGRTQRFLRASLKGWAYALEHTEQLVQLIKNQYHSQSSIERLTNEAIEIRKLALPDSIPLGQITAKRLRQVADIYSRLNLAKKLTDRELTEFIYIKQKKVDLTQQEREWLEQHPVIRLGVDQNFAPYEWIDNKGEYQGIAADYIKLLEQRLAVKFELGKNKKTWNEVLEAAKQGELDMLSCLVRTPERATFLNFSSPYLSSSAVIISEYSNGYIGSLEKLAGKRVAIQKGHYTQELLTQNYPAIQIISTESIEDALRKVSEGQAYAYVGDVTAASYVMKKEGFLNLVFSGSTPYQSAFRFATQKNNPLLTAIINKALATISQDERDGIYSQWRAFRITNGLGVGLVIKYALLIFVLFLLVIYWVYRLRQSERALKVSQTKLQLILDTEPECVKVVDADGYIMQMNPAGLKMIEVENESEVIGHKVDELVLDADRQAFNEMYARVIKGESCSLQYQIRGLNATVRWVDSHAVPLMDENNRVFVLSVTRDITEDKKTEDARKVAASVYLHSSEGMMVLDRNNLIIGINPAFSKITGYSFNEVKGKNPRLLKSGLQDNEFYKEMWATINNTGYWEGEIWNKRKNGELYPERLVVNSIFGKQGKVEQRVALFSDISKQKHAEKLIWEQANYDPLTGLPNRNMFLDRLDQDIKAAIRSEKRLALIFLDLDHFKQVNDTLGHEKGDELLCEAAKRLKNCVRISDTVARLGGDEFVIILAELDESHNIDRVAQNIIDSLSQIFELTGEHAHISASLGIALYPDDAMAPDRLIKYADQAMYLSKKQGRGRFSYFTRAMQEQAQSRMQLIHDMHKALDARQFELYYQPIIDLATGEIVKAEALIRWNHPTRGLVQPADFIPLAEDSRLIIDIGDWVFKQAARQVKYWREFYNKNIQVCINKSLVQFRAAKNSDDWLNYFKQIELSGSAIAIEITEGLLMDCTSNISHQLLQYRDAHIQVSMDNFGTGYSALSYFNKFDIDYLKIDRSFTTDLTSNSSNQALSEAIIVMSHKLGLKVIAEGIETEDQQKLLKVIDCDYGQGFLYSRPVPADEFEVLLLANK